MGPVVLRKLRMIDYASKQRYVPTGGGSHGRSLKLLCYALYKIF